MNAPEPPRRESEQDLKRVNAEVEHKLQAGDRAGVNLALRSSSQCEYGP